MTRIFVNDGKGGVIPPGDKAQPAAGKMHTTDIMRMAGDHARTAGHDDAAQIGHRHHWPMLRQQAINPPLLASVAAVAGDTQHREARGELGVHLAQIEAYQPGTAAKARTWIAQVDGVPGRKR